MLQLMQVKMLQLVENKHRGYVCIVILDLTLIKFESHLKYLFKNKLIGNCPYCQSNVTSKNSYKSHIKRYHPEKKELRNSINDIETTSAAKSSESQSQVFDLEIDKRQQYNEGNDNIGRNYDDDEVGDDLGGENDNLGGENDNLGGENDDLEGENDGDYDDSDNITSNLVRIMMSELGDGLLSIESEHNVPGSSN